MTPQTTPPKPYFVMEYIYPPEFPKACQPWDEETNKLAISLKNVDTKFVQIPDTHLSVRLFVFRDAASIEFQKSIFPVYTNFFNFEENTGGAFKMVQDFYKKYKYGTPKIPGVPTWIHSIPLRPHLLSPEETILCEKLTVCFFWAVYAQRIFKKPQNLHLN